MDLIKNYRSILIISTIIVYWLNLNTTITFIPRMQTIIWLLHFTKINSASIKHHPRMSTEFGTNKLLIISSNRWISGIHVLIVICPLVYTGSRMTAYEFLRNKVLRRNADGRFSLWYVIIVKWQVMQSLLVFWLGFYGLIYSQSGFFL